MVRKSYSCHIASEPRNAWLDSVGFQGICQYLSSYDNFLPFNMKAKNQIGRANPAIIKWLWRCFIIVIVVIPSYIYTVQINLFNLYGGLPPIRVLENPKTELASELYSADGVLLGKYFRYNRSPVMYEDISSNVIQALLATEDYRFYTHSGIDLKGLFRSFILSVLLHKNRGGGSTLTQQLAKNLFKTRSSQYHGALSKVPLVRILIMKTKEWILAIQIERAYTKKEIIAMYLNTVSFGNNAYGIKVAARLFFDTIPDQLSVEQAALLIGMLKAPSYYSPIKHPQRALQRRNTVLLQLCKYHFITPQAYTVLQQQPIQLYNHREDHDAGLATYFRSTIKYFLIRWAKVHNYDLFEDGLKIYTTIDSRLQRHAEEAVAEHMQGLQQKFEQHWGEQNPWVDQYGKEIPGFIEKAVQKSTLYKELLQKHGPEEIETVLHIPRLTKLFAWDGEREELISPIESIKYHKRILHAGLMAMDPHTGHIKAWVGGINFRHFKYDHIMQSKRQPGSAFKPIVYAAAIDNGYSPATEVIDTPVTFNLPNGKTWTPKNVNNKYTGRKLTLRQALAQSINSVTAYLTQQIGLDVVIDYTKRFGINSPMYTSPALCLGASDMSVYELTGAYSTFMNQGIYTEPVYITRIEDKYGRVLEVFEPAKKEAISAETANKMIYMLKGAVEENGTFRGLSKAMKEDNEICGKTGTTSNHSDGWCIGMAKDLCTGVWVGGENRCIHFRTIELGQGAVMARPIWEKFMLRLYDDPALPYKKGPLLDNSLTSKMPERHIPTVALPRVEERDTPFAPSSIDHLPEEAMEMEDEQEPEDEPVNTEIDVNEIL